MIFKKSLFLLLLTSIGLAVVAGCSHDKEVAKLINDLKDDDPEEREDAAKALENLGKRAEPAVGALARCLDDEDEKVRYRAAKTLAKLGLSARNASEKLGQALSKDSGQKVKYYAAKALDEIADHEPAQVKCTLPNLIEGLNEDDAKTRYYVLKTLAKLGADAHDMIHEIEKLTADSDQKVRKAAESAIRRIKKKYSDLHG